MSVSVKGTSITMTRGDTLRIQVGISKDGEIYTPITGDEVRFAAKHAKLNTYKTAYTDSSPQIIKTIPTDTMILELEPADTSSLDFGPYDYDIQITMADGTVDTFLSGKLNVLPEVD